MGDRGPDRGLRFWSGVLTEGEELPGSSGEQLPSWNSSLCRPRIVVGWIGSSTDDVQPSSSSSCSSSSSRPGTRCSFARVPSAIGSAGGRASSRFRLWTLWDRWTLSCTEGAGSVCVDLSCVTSPGLCFRDPELPMCPLAVLRESNSWLEKGQRSAQTDINSFEQKQVSLYSPQPPPTSVSPVPVSRDSDPVTC